MTTDREVRGTVLPAPRRRGKTKAGANWKYEGAKAVIPLELDLSGDPAMRARLEKQWSAAYTLERAIKSDAAHRVAAFDSWKSGRAFQSLPAKEKGRAAKEMRTQLGLTPEGLIGAAYQHVEASGWLRDHVTKAQALHHASAVWATTTRHLFPDATGKYVGPPKVGSWWDFARMVGRARSHTKKRPVWETFRLVGSLQGHVDTYAAPAARGRDVASLAVDPTLVGAQVLAQPGAMPAPARGKGSWWDHKGPLTVLFTGLKGGELNLPVRLPSGGGELARLVHFLADPDLWHKIDLVRTRDRRAPGGWRYYAHLLVLGHGWQGPSTIARRAAVDEDRLAGIDTNVSNLAAVSMPGPTGKNLDENSIRVDLVKPTEAMEQAALDTARQVATANRHLELSRRSSNPEQYELSKRQKARALRRSQTNQAPKKVQTPKGKRVSNAAGVPKRAYRKDQLSPAYVRTRADKAALQASNAARKDAVARELAATLVATHGNRWVTEDVNIATWMPLWGKRLAVTTPSRIITALQREVTATGGTFHRAATQHTALSQRCVCGVRKAKPLSQRWHSCACGLEADRDVLSAALASIITFTNTDDPKTAVIDPTLLGVLARRVGAQQEEHVRSTITLTPGSGGDGSHVRVTAAGHNDSPGQPRNSRTRKGPPRRRRNGQSTRAPLPEL